HARSKASFVVFDRCPFCYSTCISSHCKIAALAVIQSWVEVGNSIVAVKLRCNEFPAKPIVHRELRGNAPRVLSKEEQAVLVCTDKRIVAQADAVWQAQEHIGCTQGPGPSGILPVESEVAPEATVIQIVPRVPAKLGPRLYRMRSLDLAQDSAILPDVR